METQQDRLIRIQKLMRVIIIHDDKDSFLSLINNNLDLFKEFRVAYSTNNTITNLEGISLKSIEEDCSVLKKYFYGSSVLFYSDEIYEKTLQNGIVKIPVDYSLSLDSNVAECFRVWENGGNIGHDKERLNNLIHFIKNKKDNGFNFDYGFFILENLLDSKKIENERPFNTIRALKRFDFLDYDKNTFNIDLPKWKENREDAGKRTIEALYYSHTSNEIEDILIRRKVLYLILLQTVILRENNNLDFEQKISSLIEFSIDILGKFAKTELYFAWKFLKYGKNFSFFNVIEQFHRKFLQKLKGISWDLYAYRYQEFMTTKREIGDFYMPFFASFDNKFYEFSKFCSVRCILIDDVTHFVSTVYLDELEFQEDVNKCISEKSMMNLSNIEKKFKRMTSSVCSDTVDKLIIQLEKNIQKYIK